MRKGGNKILFGTAIVVCLLSVLVTGVAQTAHTDTQDSSHWCLMWNNCWGDHPIYGVQTHGECGGINMGGVWCVCIDRETGHVLNDGGQCLW